MEQIIVSGFKPCQFLIGKVKPVTCGNVSGDIDAGVSIPHR